MRPAVHGTRTEISSGYDQRIPGYVPKHFLISSNTNLLRARRLPPMGHPGQLHEKSYIVCLLWCQEFKIRIEFRHPSVLKIFT